MSRPSIGSPDWGDQLNADLTDIEDLAYSGRSRALDHGTVTGAQTLESRYALHEFNLSGATTMTPEGPPGTVLAVRVYGAGSLTVAGVSWDTAEPEVPGTFVLTHWPSSGWHASTVSGSTDIVTVTPAAPTFNDTGAVLTIPGTTGVRYRQDGADIAAGTYAGQPPGSTTITATAKTGYVITGGATVSWSHSYPGWSSLATDAFTAADGTLLTGHAASNGQAWAGTGTPALTINTNRVTFGTHGAASTRTLSVVTTHPLGLRVAADYAQNGGTVSRQGLGMNYASTAYGGNYDFTIRITQAGAFEYGGAGADDLNLTGSLTGHPSSGQLAIQVVGTVITVLINSTSVATGTLPGTLIGSRVVMIMENAGGAMDNLLVEGYS